MEANKSNTTIFIEKFDKFLKECTQDQNKLIQKSMPIGEGPKPNIARQQLKKIKKIVQSQQDSQLKNLFIARLYPVVIYEYIYGDLQSKPLVFNLLKCLQVDIKVLHNFNGQLNNFDEIKRFVEACQTIPFREQQRQNLQKELYYIINQLNKYLTEGANSIARNQFRTKWLDHFVQILRCVNFIIRFIGSHNQKLFTDIKNQVRKNIQICIQNCHVITKQVITQLYLAAVYLDPNQPMPQQVLNKVHYLHACGIVKNQNTIPKMLQIVMTAKSTQVKAQIASILLKAFQMFYKKDSLDQNLRNNSFDIVITLFDVGRSIYSYLEQIVDIIIVNGGYWNLQGNFTRKFFIVRVALKHTTAQKIMQMWPNAIKDCIYESGNMTIPYVLDCTQILLAKIYEQTNRNYQQWMKHWINDYESALLANNRSLTRGIVEFINPIILKIDSNPCLLSKLLTFTKKQTTENNQTTIFKGCKQLGVISLLKCYRQLGKIVTSTSQIQEEVLNKKQDKKKKKQNKMTYQQKYPTISKDTFVHIQDPLNIQISHGYLLELLCSNDQTIACKTLQFLTTSRKPSTLILPQQMKLIQYFYKGCLKTSMPQYRKNYLNLTRRMLQRFRRLYDRDITQKNKNPTQHYSQFIAFINKLIKLCLFNIYPDSIFEITNPALEILNLICNLFGERQVQIRKNTFITPTKFLTKNTQFFDIANFYNLVGCLKSSYESIRKLAHKILQNFKISQFSPQNRLKIKKLWQKSVQSTNKLSIRSYQFACRLLSYISTSILNQTQKMPQLQLLISEIPRKYKLKQLNVCQLMLNIMRSRYQIFKQQFIQQSQLYYNNLLHGILTFFSYLLQNQMFVPNQATSQQYQEIKSFLTQFFTQVTQILNFAVQISSANVSTVVLDTLAHGSQTDKQLKVDCRGHFLTSKEDKGGAIGDYLDSTALLTSMQNQQEGIENTLVVSFYLLTRQAGLVFQTVGELVNNKKSKQIIPKKQLIDLINTYFYALINLKHMGSVDRISIGLSKMSKVIFDHEDKDLNGIPEKLLQKLLSNLTSGKFTNILRRSAGVPYAFSCLLKSQALKRKHLIDKTINSLLSLCDQDSQKSIQLRIHSLNILKKLFQDSDLKQDLDIFVSDAFIKSINGFTSQEWGVRNSALMLFSVLANRSVGIKPTYNLLEFFHKCPKLLSFIQGKLMSLKTITMYPPLYPIVLLLSRLLPFDIKEKSRMTLKGDNNTSSKQVRKEQLLKLLPLIRSAGDNHNFMGRVMTAKAILPFMQLTNIVPHCLEILSQFFNNLKCTKIENNTQHYRLTQCYQLLLSYHQICQTKQLLSNEDNKKYSHQINKIIMNYSELINEDVIKVCSPTVLEILFKIYKQLLYFYFSNSQSNQILQTYKCIRERLKPLFYRIINQQIAYSKGIITGDLGLSLMNISVIQLIHVCQEYCVKTGNSTDQQNCIEYIKYIEHLMNDKMINQVDNQIRCLIISKICLILRNQDSFNKASLNRLKQKVFEWMRQIDLQKITNDDIMIHILELLSSAQTLLQSKLYKAQILDFLKKIQANSENKFLKMAIFKYIQSTSSICATQIEKKQLHQYIIILLRKYSNPEQLQELRQTCVQYLQEFPQNVSAECLVVYIRLLQDQEQEIRKRTSQALCRMLKIFACNEQILTQKLLKMFISDKQLPLNDFLFDIIEANSDYLIKYKNHKQSRIFSYDKPNKYRTDINTIFNIIKYLDQEGIKIFKNLLSEIQSKQNQQRYLTKNIIQQIQFYQNQIMEREEYQFEKLIRGLIMSLPQSQKYRHTLINQHPMFKGIASKVNHI